MRYELEFRPAAVHDLKRLTPAVARRIAGKLDRLCEDMAGDVKRLVAYRPGWRLRVGDWRVLFERERGRLVVYRIVHRSEAYE